MPLLVKFKDNWADEMDIEGFYVFDDPTDWKFTKEGISEGHHTMWVGTNEDIEYASKEKLLEHFEEIEIGFDEAHTLKELLGQQFGHFHPCSENW